MTVLLKTAFEDWQIVDLKLTKGVLNTVLQGKFQCYELLPGVIVVHNPEGAARSMPLSCCSKVRDVFFFGPVLVTGIDPKSGKLTNTPKWVLKKLEDWWGRNDAAE